MLKKAGQRVHLLLIVVALLTGCTINRDIMFKTHTGFEFDQFPDTVLPEFRIQPNDQLTFRLFANDGFRMIDMVSAGAQDATRNLMRVTFTYQVEFDGRVKLPLLGRIDVRGKTLREAEMYLEELYTEYYNRPFVQLSVANRRVVVFPGGAGDARIVPLENNNTTLLEVLAIAGGVARRANVKKVKLFRHEPDGKRGVYQFDLSDIDGLKHADIVMQADDVIYVQPNPEIVREVLFDLNPVIALLTSVVLVIGIVRGFN